MHWGSGKSNNLYDLGVIISKGDFILFHKNVKKYEIALLTKW